MDKKIKRYRKVGLSMYNKLRLKTFPVAVRYIKDVSEIPRGFRKPSDSGEKWYLCRAFYRARVWGEDIAMTVEDNLCISGSVLHKWIKIPTEDLLESFQLNDWYKDLDAAKKNVSRDKNYDRLAEKKLKGYKGCVVSPLTETKFVPHSILIFGNPAQVLHCVHAFNYEGKHLIESPFFGFAESCLKGIIRPFVTGRPEVILPGYGERTQAGVTDDELAIGLPGALLFDLERNLFKVGTKGLRNLNMPIRVMLPETEKVPGFDYLEKRLRAQESNKDAETK